MPRRAVRLSAWPAAPARGLAIITHAPRPRPRSTASRVQRTPGRCGRTCGPRQSSPAIRSSPSRTPPIAGPPHPRSVAPVSGWRLGQGVQHENQSTSPTSDADRARPRPHRAPDPGRLGSAGRGARCRRPRRRRGATLRRHRHHVFADRRRRCRDGERRKLALCCPPDAEPAEGFISALCRAGGEPARPARGRHRTLRTPDGEEVEHEVITILFQPEASGDDTL